MNKKNRLRIHIQGAVQGVGFRPFVYRLAMELALTGWVINDSRGVFIEAEGPRPTLTRFLERLSAEKPPRALIHSLAESWLDPTGYDRFEIRHSQESGAKTVLVLPDIATCDDCLAELLDPADRRHRYPFTNCTNCGPRFTIIEALPYDRPNTTMRRFTMCPACRTEYEAPLDRRFHAQPNACPRCGPELALYGRKAGLFSPRREELAGGEPAPAGEWPVQIEGWTLLARRDEALRRTVEALRAGRIVAVKGLGGFHLMVDARQANAVAYLRERKSRPAKPFALMTRDLAQARMLCQISERAETLLTAPEAPIMLLPRRADVPIAANIAPENDNLGVMLPYTPLHHLLLQQLDFPLVATSGNLRDEPICTGNEEAIHRLGHIADLFLLHNRPIARHVDDSVAWLVRGEEQLLRRARGYAPLPLMVSRSLPPILAVGAHLKNNVALSVERQLFISQHIGDLETVEAMIAFERVIADFLRLYETTPAAIAHDMHPDYLSTRWAQRQEDTPLIAVQHHHAHLAGCLLENNRSGPALGVTWDGTGYGPDGTIWGGEFLLGDGTGFRRVAHLRPFRLPGGEAAIREPARIALALLWEMEGEAGLERVQPPFDPARRKLIAQMLARGINTPLTSSAGRLFDGVAALIGLHQQVSFEGQAAIALEHIAQAGTGEAYPLPLVEGEPLILDWQPMLAAILADLHRKVEPAIISAKFHNGLVEAIVAVARHIGQAQVALTGGCFQNRWLTERTADRLAKAGFEVLLHRQLPPNDGGISAGQAAVAAARLAQ